MACKYCLNGELPEDFSYCPKCSEHLGVHQVLRWIEELFEEAHKRFVKSLSNSVIDENGNILELEREPIEVRHLGFDESTIAPDNHDDIDISRELEWLVISAPCADVS